jgi:hypothetical protein
MCEGHTMTAPYMDFALLPLVPMLQPAPLPEIMMGLIDPPAFSLPARKLGTGDGLNYNRTAGAEKPTEQHAHDATHRLQTTALQRWR